MRVLPLVFITLAFAGCLSGGDEGTAQVDVITITPSWNPEFPTPGALTSFGLTVSSTIEGDKVVEVIWKIGDEIFQTPTPSYTFLETGNVPVTVQVELAISGKHQESGIVQIIAEGAEPPAPPVTEPGTETEAPLKIMASIDANSVTFTYSWDETPDAVGWDFGDGGTSTSLAPTHRYGQTGIYTVTLRASGSDGVTTASTIIEIDEVPLIPHVIVGVPDSGINPYHDIYSRPDLISHPCVYIQDFPCDVEALHLSLDAPDYGTAMQQDADVWASVQPGKWYWIPGTNIVAASCASSHTAHCILDDGGQSHGTGTSSSVLTENPDALIAFREGGPDVGAFISKGIPVDVFSVSWGHADPAGIGLSLGYPTLSQFCNAITQPIYVKSSGNAPGPSILTDCWSGDPEVIAVGGAYANGRTQEETAGKDMDVVSYFCRPTANVNTLSAMRASYCGTSFSAPTVAGALSKVILAIREESGYLGSNAGEMVDPIAGVSAKQLRDAMNHTASYAPSPQYSNSGLLPLNPVAPWTQWGWGFYDGLVADATVDHFLKTPAADKPVAAVTYMESQYQLRETLYG